MLDSICKVRWSHYLAHKYIDTFCLDKMSFQRDHKSCRIGVVDGDVCPTFMETLRWYNFCTFMIRYTVYYYHSALDLKF